MSGSRDDSKTGIYHRYTEGRSGGGENGDPSRLEVRASVASDAVPLPLIDAKYLPEVAPLCPSLSPPGLCGCRGYTR